VGKIALPLAFTFAILPSLFHCVLHVIALIHQSMCFLHIDALFLALTFPLPLPLPLPLIIFSSRTIDVQYLLAPWVAVGLAHIYNANNKDHQEVEGNMARIIVS